MSRPQGRSRIIKTTAAMAAALAVVLAFQNCSKGFKVREAVSSSSLGGAGGLNPLPQPGSGPNPEPNPTVPAVDNPVWLAGKKVNEWFQIPGTKGAGGTCVCAYSGMALKQSTSEIIIAAAGGHGDSDDNRVATIRLDQDQPQWVIRSQPSTNTQIDVPYYSDGKPSARHTYYSTHYVSQVDRVMLIGAQFVYGTPPSFDTVDGFSLSTNQWDPKGTWADSIVYGKTLNFATGDIWSAYGTIVAKWDPITKRQIKIADTNDAFYMAMQNVWDPVRNQLVSIGFGDGWGYGDYPKLNAYKFDPTTKAFTQLKFNPSAAFTTFVADAPTSASFEYDPDNDRFFYYGGEEDGGRIYIIKPNAGSTWDVSILPLGPGTKNPPETADAGVNSRVRYIPRLKGLAYLHCAPYYEVADIYFIRTAP